MRGDMKKSSIFHRQADRGDRGAGGTDRELDLEMHFTCMTMVKQDVRRALTISKENGIYNFLAPRRYSLSERRCCRLWPRRRRQ